VKSTLKISTAFLATLFAGQALAASHAGAPVAPASVIVGGQPMLPTKNIVANAVNSADHTTLVAAVKAAGLVETLQSAGPFTVFAPVNAAFSALPAGTVDTLLKPENKAKLSGVLTYHVVAGRLTFSEIKSRIQKGGGSVSLKTVAGGTLVASLNGPNNIIVKDANGGRANITVYDVIQSNGVIHSIDKVLLPK
jgi:uncharacterized surface protein with fasciclin (FAS1) repeats